MVGRSYAVEAGSICSLPIEHDVNQNLDIESPPGAPEDEQEPVVPARRSRLLWPAVAVVFLTVVATVAVLAWNVTLPYYALSPGPVREVDSFIEIEDTDIFPIRGDLFMLTVSLQQVNLYEFIEAEVDEGIDLVSRRAIRPDDISPEELREQNLRAMDESKEAAIVVALDHLGYETGISGDGVFVAAVIEDTPADGALEQGDVITAIEGRPVSIGPDAVNEITSYEVGDTISLTVDRDGESLEVSVTLVENDTQPGRPMVGFIAETYNRTLDLPFEVDIDSQNIGGPSAGLMYALTIIDLLDDDDLTRGNRVAGTGTMSSDGSVGAIGGARQKVIAAQEAGAEYILVPAGNYEEALSVAGEGVVIAAVDDLDDAVEFLASLPAA